MSCFLEEFNLILDNIPIKIEFDCKMLIIKRKYAKKEIIVERNSNDCYECLNVPINPYGYPKIRFKRRWIGVHKFMYCLFNNKSVFGLGKKVIRHKCDNRLCCNPFHLEEGTQYMNVRDMIERGRLSDRRGENNPAAKLDKSAVEYILDSEMDDDYLSDIFNVSKKHIKKIRNRKIWKHL